MEKNENENEENKEIEKEENKEIENEIDNQNENLESKNDEKKNEENIKQKLPKLSKENFEEIYSKIDLIKQKHKEHQEIDNKVHFSLNDYQIDKVMHDDKLKKLFEMLEPNASRYNFTTFQKSSDFFSTYNPNNENTNKLFNSYNQTTIQNLDKLKNSNPHSTLSKIYSLFQEINKMNENIIPYQKITYNKIIPNQISNRYYSTYKSKSSNNNYLSSNPIDKKYQPVSTNKFVSSMKSERSNSNNLNNNFINYSTNLKSVKPNSFRLNFNNLRNSFNLSHSVYEKTVLNFSNWFDKFKGKYNSNYYNTEVDKLSNAIDKVGDYSRFNKKKSNLKWNYKSYSKKKFY